MGLWHRVPPIGLELRPGGVFVWVEGEGLGGAWVCHKGIRGSKTLFWKAECALAL